MAITRDHAQSAREATCWGNIRVLPLQLLPTSLDTGSVWVAVVLEGQLRLQIPELGSRLAECGQWVLLSDHTACSHLQLQPGSSGMAVGYPFALLERLQELPAKLSCLTCPRRDAAFCAQGNSTGRIDELTRALAQEGGPSFTPELMRTAHGHELLARILQQPQWASPGCSHTHCPPRDLQAIEGVASYLTANLDQDHSLSALSRRHGLNEFKLKKLFRAHYGMTVFGYLRQKRMEHAHTLLQTNDRSVLEVAGAVGYANASHFARAFRQCMASIRVT
ncbi:MAG: AraC family transcriptional regulator [Puniceicoccaceae bacterium 5H]|nr:MAG: AraC family transcriptional regulator [Puniceicoccaceae bacterium 5H]